MARVHLQDVSLIPSPTTELDFLTDERFVADLLVGSRSIAQSEPTSWGKESSSWSFKFETEIPQGCSTFEISIHSEQPGGIHFDHVEIEVTDVLSSAGESNCKKPTKPATEDFDMTTPACSCVCEVTASIKETTPFELVASFAVHNLAFVLNRLIPLSQELTLQMSDDNPRKPAQLSNLGTLLITRFEILADIRDLNESVTTLEQVVLLTPDSHPSKYSWLKDLANVLSTRFEKMGDLVDLNQSIAMKQEAVKLVPNGHPDVVSLLINLGISLFKRFLQLEEIGDLNESITKFQGALQLAPDSHMEKLPLVMLLGSSLLTRFERLDEIDDLNLSVANKREAAELTPQGHPHKSQQLGSLGITLLTRFERLSEIGDLDEAIARFNHAVLLTPDGHKDKPHCLSNLGVSLLRRFNQLGEIGDLQESIAKIRDAVRLTPDGTPGKPTWLSNLGDTLVERFKRLGDIGDLNECISQYQDAVLLVPDSHLQKPTLLNNLGSSLHRRFKHLGDMGDLNMSIAMSQDAMKLTPVGCQYKPSWLKTLGDSLITRFDQLGDTEDLEESITKFSDAALLTPDGHHDKPPRLSDLASALLKRFERLGCIGDLEESIAKNTESLLMIPDGHRNKPEVLGNLGNSLLARFEQLGEISDLNRAVAMKQDAVRLARNDYPDKPSMLSNLGNALLTRFKRLGDVEDLTQSVDRKEEAVRLTPDSHPEKLSLLINLGASLLGRFDRLGNIGDLTEFVTRTKDAVKLVPDGHPHKHCWFNNMGKALIKRFERLGVIGDLNESVAMFREAGILVPEGHPDKPFLLNSLAVSLYSRFNKLGNIENLNESIAKAQDAVLLTPDGHPAKLSHMLTLGGAVVMHFLHLHSPDYLELAKETFSAAAKAQYGTPFDRIGAARFWAQCLRLSDNGLDTILEPYQIAVPLVSEVLWLGSSLRDRQHQVMTVGKVVQEAAAMAFEVGELELAVEWLEQGRSVIWGQLLHLRSPIDDLALQEPELSCLLKQNSSMLENAMNRHIFEMASTGINPSDRSLDDIALSGHQLAEERQNLLKDIRSKRGFENFLLPKSVNQLIPASSNGPVIMLSFSELDDASHAFILQPNVAAIQAVRLETFPPSKALQVYQQLSELLLTHGRVPFSYGNLEEEAENSPNIGGSWFDVEENILFDEELAKIIAEKRYSTATCDLSHSDEKLTSEGFAEILAELWHHVSKPILDEMGIVDAPLDTKGRIWWCPTGILSFLPLHAAGVYDQTAGTQPQLSDYVISSYVPTISALLKANANTLPLPAKPRLLAIATEGIEKKIPATLGEIKSIQATVETRFQVTLLHGEDATLENVRSEIKFANWVHFACHGVQHPTDPTASALLLAGDDKLTLEELSTFQIIGGELAFLSACEIAKGDEELSDEAVHLGAGMLLAGYKGVIATMWSVDDKIAAEVASEVYKKLESIDFNAAEAAWALDAQWRAQQDVFDDASLLSKILFIHIGR